MRVRWGVILVVATVVLGITALPQVAGLVSPGSTSGIQSAATGGAQTNIDCGACHDDETKRSFPNSAVCTNCHVTIGQTYQRSIHSTATDTQANFDCLECHAEPEDSWFMHFQQGPHGSQAPGISMAPEDTCAQAGCHDAHNPAGPVYGEWEETRDDDWSAGMLSHSKPAPSIARTQTCSPCHGTHDGSIANIEDATRIENYATDTQPDPIEVDEWRITCAACHDPHDVRAEDTLRGDFEDGSRLCGQCHTDPELQAGGEEAVSHPARWELYSQSTFANGSGTHPELECYSCHMAGQADTADSNAITGHSFEVDTGLLSDTDRLVAPESADCGSCHVDLDGTLAERERDIAGQLETAHQLRAQAHSTLDTLGLADDPAYQSRMDRASAWIELIDSPTQGVHNPELARNRLREAIETFQAVQLEAYRTQAGTDGEPPVTSTTTTTITTSTPTTQQTETETPGPGIALTVLGVLAGMLLVHRYR